MNSRLAVLVALLMMGGQARADVKLPRLIGDGMVLQRNAPLKVWGWADAGERVRVDFRGYRAHARTDSRGRWSVMLPPQRPGGPDEMRVAGGNVLTVRNVLVGDVWLASGQSNMQYPMAEEGGFGGVRDAEREIQSAAFPLIRLFSAQSATSLRVVDDVGSAGWHAVTPQSVRRFSAVGYLFARELYRRYQVPIGIIESDWGGTPVETWISEEGLRSFPEFAASVARQARIAGDAAANDGYDAYLAGRDRWYLIHGREDRGSAAGSRWFAPGSEAIDWPTVREPQPWPAKPPKGFDGTMWYRKEIELSAAESASPVRLHLSHLLQADTTYFNGEKVGETKGEVPVRDYAVPSRWVSTGRNTIVVRLEGQYQRGDGYVGMLGDPSDMYAEVGERKLPLAGIWRYQPGPDLSGLPAPPPLAEFRSKFPQAPTLLFNAMIEPLTPYRLRGVIWYQGESNIGRAVQYRSLFRALIEDWRAHWGYRLPFLFVQLAGYDADPPEPGASPRAELREAQSAALALPATAMATAVDLGDRQDIHPKNKQDIAHRLALAAAGTVYGDRVVFRGPTYRSMRLEGAGIRIQFSDTGAGLQVADPAGRPLGFTIAAQNGVFVRAQARLDGNDVIVANESIQVPKAVRYDWANTPVGNLYNSEGLPATPFRTDR